MDFWDSIEDLGIDGNWPGVDLFDQTREWHILNPFYCVENR